MYLHYSNKYNRMAHQDPIVPDVVGNVERDRYRNARIDAKLENILELIRAATIRHNHLLQELQKLQENQKILSQKLEAVKHIAKHNDRHLAHADRREFLDRDGLNDDDVPRKVCNIPPYDGNDDEMGVNSEDLSSEESPTKKQRK